VDVPVDNSVVVTATIVEIVAEIETIALEVVADKTDIKPLAQFLNSETFKY